MNSWEFDSLKMRITTRLRNRGPATADVLAAELDAPHGNVRFALDELRGKEKSVESLPFGLWDLAEDQQKVA
jgi:predicted ArsR family transcriptional regulator